MISICTCEGSHRSLHGKVAYVPQKAFILNGSLESNITFGEPYDKVKFDDAVSAAIVMVAVV